MATLRAVAASRSMSASTERCNFSEARSAAACRSDSRRNGAANEMACSPKVRSVVPSVFSATSVNISSVSRIRYW